MSKSLIIFGGSGFIGRHICQKALEKGYLVYSVSTHGKPDINEQWVNHANMTWIASKIDQKELWQSQLPTTAHYCMNLIGILTPTKNKTYENSIIKPNELISHWAETHHIPYLFLSARFGPLGYIRAKKQAECYLSTKQNPVTIVYSGLVVDQQLFVKRCQATVLKIGSNIPVLSHWCRKVYPIEVQKLATQLLNITFSTDKKSKLVDLTQ